MRSWGRKTARAARVSWCRVWMRILEPFATTRSFQKVFFGALGTGAAFALIRMFQTFSGSSLNNSKWYAALSLACPIVILGLVFWVMRRQSIDAASLSARSASERAHKSLEQALAEREREELGMVAPSRVEDRSVDQQEPPKRRSNRL